MRGLKLTNNFNSMKSFNNFLNKNRNHIIIVLLLFLVLVTIIAILYNKFIKGNNNINGVNKFTPKLGSLNPLTETIPEQRLVSLNSLKFDISSAKKSLDNATSSLANSKDNDCNKAVNNVISEQDKVTKASEKLHTSQWNTLQNLKKISGHCKDNVFVGDGPGGWRWQSPTIKR